MNICRAKSLIEMVSDPDELKMRSHLYTGAFWLVI